MKELEKSLFEKQVRLTGLRDVLHLFNQTIQGPPAKLTEEVSSLTEEIRRLEERLEGK